MMIVKHFNSQQNARILFIINIIALMLMLESTFLFTYWQQPQAQQADKANETQVQSNITTDVSVSPEEIIEALKREVQALKQEMQTVKHKVHKMENFLDKVKKQKRRELYKNLTKCVIRDEDVPLGMQIVLRTASRDYFIPDYCAEMHDDKKFKKRCVIRDDDVPSDMQIVHTPYGDRLFIDNKGTRDCDEDESVDKPEPPNNPCGMSVEEAAKRKAEIQKRRELYKQFKKRVIRDEDVPCGMRVVRTPFGDRLVSDYEGTHDCRKTTPNEKKESTTDPEAKVKEDESVDKPEPSNPVSPFRVMTAEEIAKREAEVQKRRELYKRLKKRVIRDEDVPPGMRIVRTPFGDRLVPDNR